MPPKFKFTKDRIIEAAFDLVRENGWQGLTTRTLAGALGTSARPIYSFFDAMTELEEEIVKKAVELLHKYMQRKKTADPWHDHGIGYVMFAVQEKYLFQSINDEKHISFFKKYGDLIWATLTASLSDYPPFQGLSDEQIYRIQIHRWLFAHGLAFSACNTLPEIWSPERIVLMIQEGSQAIYTGMVNKFRLENK
jgi:AcrR family transcriptional regulator